jgi:hypothetical protein
MKQWENTEKNDDNEVERSQRSQEGEKYYLE